MITKEEAIEDSIKHWRCMIKWAEKYAPKRDHPYTGTMNLAIHEDWYDSDCALCKKYRHGYHCSRNCPLAIKYGKCGYKQANMWGVIDTAKTWTTWIKNAKIMLKQLRSLRTKPSSTTGSTNKGGK